MAVSVALATRKFSTASACISGTGRYVRIEKIFFFLCFFLYCSSVVEKFLGREQTVASRLMASETSPLGRTVVLEPRDCTELLVAIEPSVSDRPIVTINQTYSAQESVAQTKILSLARRDKQLGVYRRPVHAFGPPLQG